MARPELAPAPAAEATPDGRTGLKGNFAVALVILCGLNVFYSFRTIGEIFSKVEELAKNHGFELRGPFKLENKERKLLLCGSKPAC
jgi:hypothetical protein